MLLKVDLKNKEDNPQITQEDKQRIAEAERKQKMHLLYLLLVPAAIIIVAAAIIGIFKDISV